MVQTLLLRINELTQQNFQLSRQQDHAHQTEKMLRAEILHTEEQRAYIDMLKNNVESKIRQVGLNFCDMAKGSN